MRLDRNTNANGRGKYALINLRTNTVQWGDKGTDDEFFVIKLKDIHAPAALRAYADSIADSDPQFAGEVRGMAYRAELRPDRKQPD